MSSSYAHKLMMRAVPLHRQGKLAEAEGVYRQVIAMEPQNADALHLLGVLLHQSGRTAEGLILVERAIAVRPGVADFHVNAAELLRVLGRYEESLAHTEAAARINPNIPELHNNVATLHMAMNHLDAAEQALRRALGLRANFAEAWVNVGNLADRRGKAGEAVEAYGRALQINPKSAEALASLGNVLAKEGRTEEALGALLRSIEINPRISKAHNNLANGLQSRGLLAESIAAYRQAIELDPANLVAFSNLLFALNRDPAASPEEVLETHLEFGLRAAGRSQKAEGRVEKGDGRRLRVGYVSPDFRRHSVMYFLEPVLRHHDRARFEVRCYSNTVRTDAVTERVKGLVDGWHDITAMNDDEAARLIRSHGVDVLVDLAGHTEGNRLLVFARRPAPVQVTWLGYPNTTGLAEMDYRVTDGVADPIGETERYHAEVLLRMGRVGWCYLPPADAPDVGRRPREGVTFGSFNNLVKVGPAWVGVWARILKAVPEARLLLKSRALDDAGTRAYCAEQFARHDVGAERLDLRGWEASAGSHLAMYNEVDVALDTFPYHGTTTTCEALYMGVPVVTLAGRTHVSRVGVSLLSSVGLDELVTRSEEQYVRIAVDLARDRAQIERYRAELRRRVLASPLCDAAGFTRELEGLYMSAWEERCQA